MDLLTPQDRDQWLLAWELTGREPFVRPEYIDAVSDDGVRAALLVDEIDDVRWALPLIMRDLPDELGVVGSDCVSPYGFGGPYSSRPRAPAERFMNRFAEWVANNRMASAFVRLDVGLNIETGPLSRDARIVTVAPVVSVDLTRSPADRWSTYDAKVRKNVRRAMDRGCRAESVDPLRHYDEFAGIYHSTLARRSADSSYYFSSERLKRFVLGAPDQADLWLVYAADGEPVSTELVLVSDTSAYSFLGGTLAEAFPLRPNDLLKHEICEHYAAGGKARYVLGGGYRPNDGIFKYKKSFDPEGVTSFRGAQIKGEAALYSLAVDQHLTLGDVGSDGSYFPPYRGPRRAS